MKQQFLVDIADTFKTYVYANNRKAVPTSATLTVYKPGTSEKLIDGAAMTVASDGLLSYSLTAVHNDVADDNYKAVIAYVLGGSTYYATVFYDVVRSKLSIVITDDEIVDELPQLRDNGWRVRGTADSGSTTTIVDAELKRWPDDYFTGGAAYSIDRDETRDITDFVSSTGTVTTAAFSGAIATDKYVLTRAFTREIQRAFEKIEDKLKSKGKRAHLILDSADLRMVHIYQSVAEICKGLMTVDDGSVWGVFFEKYDIDEKGSRAFWALNNLNLKYDESEDGYISGSEEGRRSNRTIGRG
ncbi:MAG: hypothetical protein ACE5FA_10690 [Dehalococcoidia bacterium]